MRTAATSESSLFGLIRGLADETKTLIKEEVQLAKTEISENISRLGRNAVTLAIGGFVAYAGLIVLLAGLGMLLAFAFEKAGLQPVLAGFLGLFAIGLLAVIFGGIFVLNAVKILSKESLAPEKTLHTLKELKGHEPAHQPEAARPQPEPKRSSDEIQASVVTTGNRIGETMEEISHRLSRKYIDQKVKQKYRVHPYRWNLIAMGTGIAGGFLIKNKFQHAK